VLGPATVQAGPRGDGDCQDLVRLEGLDGSCAVFRALGRSRGRILGQPEGIPAHRVLEDRVDDLAMDVDGASAHVLAIQG
jgi:hypothetical protein